MILKPIENIDLFVEKSEPIIGVFCSKKWLSVYGDQLTSIGIYKDENGTLIPEPKEFEIVKSIFSLRKSGLKIRQISDVIKNKFGRKIHFTQCHRILNREYNQKLLGFI